MVVTIIVGAATLSLIVGYVITNTPSSDKLEVRVYGKRWEW